MRTLLSIVIAVIAVILPFEAAFAPASMVSVQAVASLDA